MSRIKKEKTPKEKKSKKEKRLRNDSDVSLFSRAIFLVLRGIEKLEQSAPVRKKVSEQREIIKARAGTDTGYADYALKLRLFRIILCALLVLAALLGVVFSAGRLAIDNLYYTALDIGYMNSYSESSNGNLNYTKTQISNDFALYKNGLATASNSEIKLFNATGRVTLTSGDIFANPVIVTSNKYIIVYDLGGSKFSVYNSFKKIETVTLDGCIASASMSEDGGFTIVEKTQDYNSVVYMYNDDCDLISTYSSNKYVLSAEMSQNGKFTAVLSTSAQNGEMTSYLTVLKNSKKIYAEIDMGNMTPYMCRFISDKTIAVFCSDRVCVYDLRGKLKGEYEYPDSRLAYISYTSGGASLLFEDDIINGQNTLVVLDKNGKVTYKGKLSGSYTDMQIYGDYVFLLTNNGICKFNHKTKIITFKESSDTFGQILVCDKNRVLLCTDSRGIYFDME